MDISVDAPKFRRSSELPLLSCRVMFAPDTATFPVKVPVVPDTAPREVSDPAVKLVTIPVVALKVAAVVIPAISTPVGDSVTVPTPDRLLILSTLISDAIWVHFPPDCFTI